LQAVLQFIRSLNIHSSHELEYLFIDLKIRGLRGLPLMSF